MQLPVFITGNQSKADYLAKYLNLNIEHTKLDLDEIQSIDVREVASHKAAQAFALVGKPVLVDDTSLEFEAFGRFPGTFIKFMYEEAGSEAICRSLDTLSRRVTRKVVMAYRNGDKEHIFEASSQGTIADHPRGTKGFGWDDIFIPDGYSITRAEMNDKEYEASYLRNEVFEKLKEFLS